MASWTDTLVSTRLGQQCKGTAVITAAPIIPRVSTAAASAPTGCCDADLAGVPHRDCFHDKDDRIATLSTDPLDALLVERPERYRGRDRRWDRHYLVVDPAAGGRSKVSIGTEWHGASSIGGFFERLLAPRVMRSIYADELRRLDVYAREQAATRADSE